jgi:hypothetical protein
MRRLGSIVLAAYFFTMMLAFLVSAIVQSVGEAFGVSPVVSPSHGYGLLRLAFMASAMVASLTGGYIAAWLDDRAPLASAVALGITWSSLGIIGAATTGGNGAPGWFRVCVPVLLVVGPALGGILRVRAQMSGGRTEPIAPVRATDVRPLATPK